MHAPHVQHGADQLPSSQFDGQQSLHAQQGGIKFLLSRVLEEVRRQDDNDRRIHPTEWFSKPVPGAWLLRLSLRVSVLYLFVSIFF